MKGIVIAGTHSGAGKTTISLALMAALRHRGIVVQAFKVGPDFIDPGHHGLVTGRPSHNLDGWMLDREENLGIFNRYASTADLVVVEGVMGLYDGFDGTSEAGSTAQMAKWLGLPVLLCVDSRSMARSIGAVALGFVRFDPGLEWAGLLANRVGSDRHLLFLDQAMASVPDIDFLGGLSRNLALTMPERHLGLVTAEENPLSDRDIDVLADWLESGLDISRLLDRLPESGFSREISPVPQAVKPSVRLGVARDEAFCFYYHENLRRLEAAGAELIFFSPIRDRSLPEDLGGLYFGGGYPEVFAEELAANRTMMEAVARFGRSGKPIYGECGGFMYLGCELTDLHGRTQSMTGLLPVHFRMLPRLKSLGYRRVTLNAPTVLGPAGMTMRGHEFHYSEITRSESMRQVYNSVDKENRLREGLGFMKHNILGSYVHLHFGSNPDSASNLVNFCRNPGIFPA